MVDSKTKEFIIKIVEMFHPDAKYIFLDRMLVVLCVKVLILI